MRTFDKNELKKLYKPAQDSKGEDNGQVTIIGGSKLFHGAPFLSLKVASRIVDMVFLASPEPSVGGVAEHIKSRLFSFIWVPWNEVEEYIAKSDAVLIGPGFMRYKSEKRQATSDKKFDQEGETTREITKRLLREFPNKKWVIDAGSLQVMDVDWIPKNAVLTPNWKEFEMLFGARKSTSGVALDDSPEVERVNEAAQKYNCIINAKGPTNIVCSPEECVEVKGGNPGLTKGGPGDGLAGLVVALLAKSDPFLAASAASCIAKAAADELFKKVGTNYNADDLADKIPEVLRKLTN
jgi:NAD(P)H-hydrate epimerase